MDSIQSELNSTLGFCQADGMKIERMCLYHASRLNCTLYRLPPTSVEHLGDIYRVHPTFEAKCVANLFEHSRPPAGGWCLVPQQRFWLDQQLRLILRQSDKATVNVAIAGCAGPAHFYGFLLLLRGALLANPSKRVRVSVIDQCQTPLTAIDLCERKLASQWHTEYGRHRDHNHFQEVGGLELRFLFGGSESGVTPDSRSFGNISVELVRDSISHMDKSVERSGCFDIICEHFLTSFLPEELIYASRSAYSKSLAPDGKLLVASGESKEALLKDSYLLSEFKEEEVAKTWDLYDASKEQLFRLTAGMPIDIVANNYLRVLSLS